jgi:hypothetical protein
MDNLERSEHLFAGEHSVSFHSCWGVKPADGQLRMPLEEFQARLAGAFPVHKFDAEAGRQGALRRLEALQKLSVPVPEEVLAAYRDAHPVCVSLADKSEQGRAALDFVVWPEKDGSVSGVKVYFGSEERERESAVLLSRLAEALGWEAEDVTDEE